MLSLVSVDELPVPSDKRIQNPPCTEKKKPCQMLSNPHGMIAPLSMFELVKSSRMRILISLLDRI